LMGLAIPFGIIYVIDLLNDKIKNRKEIEKATKAPILADISFAESDEALVVSNLGRTVMAEQIRALRTNISFLNPGKGVQSILFTSSMSGEGKSFISLNLGASLAMTDKKTVILELDMRKPKLHSALNMPNQLGLSNYLVGTTELKGLIRPVPGQENYFIITCGPIPPNPAELLLNGRLDELFNELRAAFDYIIIDAPPVGIVTDAQILEQQADATIFVVRHNFTPKERLKMLDNLYRERKFKNLNLVFNGIKEGGKYGYGYGYGYGYYEQEKETPGLLKNTLNGFKKEKVK
jgi:tyrosine-protein kinase Etk/Wzc